MVQTSLRYGSIRSKQPEVKQQNSFFISAHVEHSKFQPSKIDNIVGYRSCDVTDTHGALELSLKSVDDDAAIALCVFLPFALRVLHVPVQ